MSEMSKYNAWLACPAMPEELLCELKSMEEDARHDAFYRDLAFGTGGLRGVLGAGTNRMNVFTVMKATRGLGAYLLGQFKSPSCAVSFDSRIHSEDFARLTAATLAEMGVKVWLYPRLQPTPMLSFAVRHLSASAGVMVTASHNPARFNGYKVYGADGCQITLEAAERILARIALQPDLSDTLPDFEKHLASGMIRYITEETIEAYYASVWKLRVRPSSCPLHRVSTVSLSSGRENSFCGNSGSTLLLIISRPNSRWFSIYSQAVSIILTGSSAYSRIVLERNSSRSFSISVSRSN